MDQPLRCACGCGAELPAGATRRRLYHSTACRVRAARKRAAVDRACVEICAPAPARRKRAGAPAAPAPDDQLAEVLRDLLGLIGILAELGREARPEHAWRCERLAGDLRAAVADYFPEVLR